MNRRQGSLSRSFSKKIYERMVSILQRIFGQHMIFSYIITFCSDNFPISMLSLYHSTHNERKAIEDVKTLALFPHPCHGPERKRASPSLLCCRETRPAPGPVLYLHHFHRSHIPCTDQDTPSATSTSFGHPDRKPEPAAHKEENIVELWCISNQNVTL